MAFKVAAGQALKKAVPEAKPILLEPIYNVDVVIPEDYMGDVMGDFSSRRGRILGMEHHRNRKGIIVVKAQVPLAEMRDYVTVLRSMTQGKVPSIWNSMPMKKYRKKSWMKSLKRDRPNNERPA